MQRTGLHSIFGIILLLGTQALAQSVLNFPRLSYEAGTLTGFAIVNPSDEAVPVTLTAYDDSGQIVEAEGFTNPREIVIPPNSQFTDTSLTIFGTTLGNESRVVWLQASSPAEGLTGFFLFLNIPTPEISFFDGADLPVADREIVFNEVRIDDGFSTEVNLINPGSQPANVELQLMGGAEAAPVHNLVIPPRGVARMDLAETFGDRAATTSGPLEARFLVASSDQEIAGFEFVRRQGDLLGLNARPRSEQLNTLLFPQLAVLDPFETQLVLVNYGAEQAIVTVTAFRPNGLAYGSEDLQSNPVVLPLSAGAVVRLDLEELFGFSGPTTLQGWVKVESTSGVVNGSLSYTIPAFNSRAAVTALGEGRTEVLFSHIATTGGFFTGIALLNGASLAANVRVVALRPDGTLLGIYSTTLLPGQRLSELLSNLIPEAAGQAGGLIWVDSDVPIYAISLFGSGTVLANIPAQAVAPEYQPDRGQPRLRVEPDLAILATGRSQDFEVSGAAGTPAWSVNGVPGGNDTVGTIGADGLYRAPEALPEKLPVTISAQLANLTAGASVDVISPQVLYGGLGLVQSIAYLSGQQRLFSAELLVLGQTEGSLTPTGASPGDSAVFDVTGGERISLASFPGEDIPKMIPFRPGDGGEYLLMAARTSGRILRLDPDSGESVTVASGLDSPSAIVLDPGSGDLLVAEATRITTVNAARLQQSLASTSREHRVRGRLAEQIAPRGVAIDACTGDVYFSDAASLAIRVIDRERGDTETVVEGVEAGQLLAVYREGLPCPASLRLLAVEPGARRVSLVNPADGTVDVFLDGDYRDVILLPPGNPLTGVAGILASRISGDVGEILQVDLPGLYGALPGLTPPTLPRCLLVALRDPVLETAVRAALGLEPAAPIGCGQAESLTVLDVTGESTPGDALRGSLPAGPPPRVTALDGLEVFVNLEVLRAGNNDISDLTPLSALTRLRELRIHDNQVESLAPLAGLSDLQSLDASRNTIQDLSPLSGLEGLTELRLEGNDLSGDLSPLGGLARLVTLDASENLNLADVGPLSGLLDLELLDLEFCSIESIAPLVANPGLDTGDRILLSGNPLNEQACEDVQALRERGAGVAAGETQCSPSPPGGGVGVAHVYEFQNSLIDSLGGPNLEADGGQVDDTDYAFQAGEGLVQRNGAFDPSDFSIELALQLEEVSGARKILDLGDRNSDNGLYVVDGRLEFRPTASDPQVVASPNEMIHLVMTRGENCNVFDVCSLRVFVYVDGDPVLNFDDPDGVAAPLTADRALTFFLDDLTTMGAESSAGRVERIRIYNGVLSSQEVRDIAGGGCGPAEMVFGGCDP